MWSNKVPEINYSPPIKDLFGFFAFNWNTLTPAISLLLGIFVAFYIAKLLINNFRD